MLSAQPDKPALLFLQSYQLLDSDNHANFLRRHGKDPANYRPDICHQVCLCIEVPLHPEPCSVHLLLLASLVHWPPQRRTAYARDTIKQLHLRLQLPAGNRHIILIRTILLQALLAILDSPLAKAGKLKVITGDRGGYGVDIRICGCIYHALGATA